MFWFYVVVEFDQVVGYLIGLCLLDYGEGGFVDVFGCMQFCWVGLYVIWQILECGSGLVECFCLIL